MQFHRCIVYQVFKDQKSTLQFGSAKWFWPSISMQNVEAGKRYSKSLTLAIDWLDGLTGPSGLLLIFSHLLQFLLYGWGWKKVN
jgi:hypothetical protein